jgi:hypothetical protein
MAGWIADVAIWNVVLTDVQIWMLAQGYSPFDIGARPYLYFPMGRGHEYDDVRGTMLLPLGTLSYPTPNVRPPAVKDWERQLYRFMDVPAAPATTSIDRWFQPASIPTLRRDSMTASGTIGIKP